MKKIIMDFCLLHQMNTIGPKFFFDFHAWVKKCHFGNFSEFSVFLSITFFSHSQATFLQAVWTKSVSSLVYNPLSDSLITYAVCSWVQQILSDFQMAKKRKKNGIHFVTKIVLTYCEILRLLEQFVRTVNGQNNFW